jgi:DNA-binding Xre family transcriptional regulator
MILSRFAQLALIACLWAQATRLNILCQAKVLAIKLLRSTFRACNFRFLFPLGKSMSVTIYSSPLLATVQRAVRNRPRSLTLDQLAAECGVGRSWLASFASGKMPGVTAVTLERIYVRLTGEQLVAIREPAKTPA